MLLCERVLKCSARVVYTGLSRLLALPNDDNKTSLTKSSDVGFGSELDDARCDIRLNSLASLASLVNFWLWLRPSFSCALSAVCTPAECADLRGTSSFSVRSSNSRRGGDKALGSIERRGETEVHTWKSEVIGKSSGGLSRGSVGCVATGHPLCSASLYGLYWML